MHRRFSHLDLVTSMAIVSILAALAIPSVHVAALRSKQAETFVMREQIAAHASAYLLATDEMPTSTTWWPALATLGKTLRPWSAGLAPLGFREMGFEPDGDVRGSYIFWIGLGAAWVSARTDLDGDGAIAIGEDKYDSGDLTYIQSDERCSAWVSGGCGGAGGLCF